jgi:hypothetical protein
VDQVGEGKVVYRGLQGLPEPQIVEEVGEEGGALLVLAD